MQGEGERMVHAGSGARQDPYYQHPPWLTREAHAHTVRPKALQTIHYHCKMTQRSQIGKRFHQTGTACRHSYTDEIATCTMLEAPNEVPSKHVSMLRTG